MTYLAALFLGQLHERDGRFEQALECYRTATHEYPESQTAYLALGHLLEAQGRSDEGWPVVRGIFGSARDRRNPERDPWWVYGYAQFWQLSDLVERLRGMARR